jgi:hypothetical protein
MVFDTTFSEAKDVLIAQDLFSIKSPLAFFRLFLLESFGVYKVIFKKEIRNNSLQYLEILIISSNKYF